MCLQAIALDGGGGSNSIGAGLRAKAYPQEPNREGESREKAEHKATNPHRWL